MNDVHQKDFTGAFVEIAGLLFVLLLWAEIYAFVPDGEDRTFVASIALIVLSPFVLLGLYAAPLIGVAIATIGIAAFRALHPKR
jgi:hypothetical protein